MSQSPYCARPYCACALKDVECEAVERERIFFLKMWKKHLRIYLDPGKIRLHAHRDLEAP